MQRKMSFKTGSCSRKLYHCLLSLQEEKLLPRHFCCIKVHELCKTIAHVKLEWGQIPLR